VGLSLEQLNSDKDLEERISQSDLRSLLTYYRECILRRDILLQQIVQEPLAVKSPKQTGKTLPDSNVTGTRTHSKTKKVPRAEHAPASTQAASAPSSQAVAEFLPGAKFELPRAVMQRLESFLLNDPSLDPRIETMTAQATEQLKHTFQKQIEELQRRMVTCSNQVKEQTGTIQRLQADIAISEEQRRQLGLEVHVWRSGNEQLSSKMLALSSEASNILQLPNEWADKLADAESKHAQEMSLNQMLWQKRLSETMQDYKQKLADLQQSIRSAVGKEELGRQERDELCQAIAAEKLNHASTIAEYEEYKERTREQLNNIKNHYAELIARQELSPPVTVNSP